jgi:hypothetical protein
MNTVRWGRLLEPAEGCEDFGGAGSQVAISLGHGIEQLRPPVAVLLRYPRRPVKPCDCGFDPDAGIGQLPGKAFDEDQTEGVDVTGGRSLSAFSLFGAEVVRGADRHPVRREPGAVE